MKTIALITGANQGIGLQIAKDLAAHGYTVLVGSRDLARGQAAAQTIPGDARPIQLDVTDQTSVLAAGALVEKEFGRLDVLINNAAISNISKTPEMSLLEFVQSTSASKAKLDEVRAVWETNAFGVLTVTQVMLPLLRKSTAARIVNVSSGAGSLTLNSDPAFAHRPMFGPVYPASKAAMNAITVAFAVELEREGIKVNAVSPGFTKTNLNAFEGTETVEEGAAQAVKMALLGADGPTGTFTHATMGTLPW
ncbi:dehydrogenase [bacterium SCN 62-11]|nr:SDR family NAD(P)-dependent oxidoreductase [Candidatus Eremiobacteraeota bacterium]ODT60054.1 MAG: dehydrogenase [bacterium SCN 62-11]